MIGDASDNDVLEQYRSISNKLKKRFLRKPNVTEACEEYSNLGKHCENYDMPSYAGMCWIAAARCEGSLKNVQGETSCLTRAARQFLKAEDEHTNLGCPSPSGENLTAALNCFSHAISRYPDKCPLNISLNLEMAAAMKNHDKSLFAEQYLKNAVELSRNSLDTQLITLEMLASYYVEHADHTKALDIYTEMATILGQAPKTGAHSDMQLKCEIDQILLLLILKPAPQSLPAPLAQLLEKYTWADEIANQESVRDHEIMSEDMFILIQSLVLTCQSLDTTSLIDLEAQLWPMLDTEQKELLRFLVRINT